MKLYIDTADNKKVVIRFDKRQFEKAFDRNQRSQILLTFIDEKLKEIDKTVEDVSEIEVNTGPGSFTGLRVGLTVANTIGWDRNILVNGQNIKNEGPVVPTY